MALAALSFLLVAWALRRAWLDRRFRYVHTALALACALLGSAIAITTFGAELGVPIAVAIAAPVSLLILFLGRTVRSRAALTPNSLSPSGVGTAYSDAARLLLSVVLTAVVAVSIVAICAVILPFEAQTRAVIALYLLPLAWACGMAWAISASNVTSVIVTGVVVALAGAAVVLPRLVGGA